jgi:hypothetical protein
VRIARRASAAPRAETSARSSTPYAGTPLSAGSTWLGPCGRDESERQHRASRRVGATSAAKVYAGFLAPIRRGRFLPQCNARLGYPCADELQYFAPNPAVVSGCGLIEFFEVWPQRHSRSVLPLISFIFDKKEMGV